MEGVLYSLWVLIQMAERALIGSLGSPGPYSGEGEHIGF